MNYKSYLAQYKALDSEQGTFEAIVAVFGNIDLMGDKIIPGAFAKSLENWRAKGRPIPVVFAHDHRNLDAHIGEVLDAKEIEQGLWIKGGLEMDEPFAQRVFKKMKKGTLAEFSFAYDLVSSAWVEENGKSFQELRELDIIEVGPCLKGANPETALLGVKADSPAYIQAAHDLLLTLGAKCPAEGDSDPAPDDETADGRKSSSGSAETLAERLRIETLL